MIRLSDAQKGFLLFAVFFCAGLVAGVTYERNRAADEIAAAKLRALEAENARLRAEVVHQGGEGADR